jgi:iron(III) transport system permease protein
MSDAGLTRWRFSVTAVVVLLMVWPLIVPFGQLLVHPAGWHAWAEPGRLLELAGNTLYLAAGTLALALPAGTLAAVLLYRTDLPFRKGLRFLTVLTLFVPLPLFASAWQAALGTGGWLPLGIWGTPSASDPDISPTGMVWKPWAQGPGAAMWVHATAALPWVILIVGQGLTWVERELEEEALTLAGPWRVLWNVTLPRSGAALAAAGLWVVLPVVTEITVTDKMQVRTFAEEVYTQWVVGDRTTSLLRSVAVTIPSVIVAGVLVAMLARRVERKLPPLESRSVAPLTFPLGWARWLYAGAMLLAVLVLAGVPLGSLIWKAGLAGRPAVWSGATAWGHVAKVFYTRWPLVATSLELAAVGGFLVAGISLLLAWLARGSRWFYGATLVVLAAAWVVPAPLVGIGLKEVIGSLLDLTHLDLLARLLYYGPSPAPVAWAYLVRFLPFGLAMLWPTVRLIPVELRETAQVDGARPGQLLTWVIWPLVWTAWLETALAMAILSLGELGASRLVKPAGSETFAHVIFEQMHWGVTNDLAALCLVLLALVAIGGLSFAGLRRLVGRDA